jgi:hypothetical protein
MRDETERRLRAVVRALVSPGIWLLVATQMAYPLLRHTGLLGGEKEAASLVNTLVFAVIATAVLYLQAGVFQSLARDREAVSVANVLRAGKERFADFIWLVVKAGLAFGLVLGALLILLMPATNGSSPAEVSRIATPFALLMAILPVLLLWWLPGVFVSSDFRLVASLRRAWRELVAQPVRSIFPAILVLLPSLVLLALPDGTPVILQLALEAMGMLIVWVADIYCVEWLVDSAPSSGGSAESASA